MQAWMVVLSEFRAIDWVIDKSRMAFLEHVNASGLSQGDPLILYATRHAFHNPARDVSRVFATAEVAGPVRKRRTEIAGAEFHKACPIRLLDVLPPREGVPFKDLLEDLDFIRNKANWANYVRRTLVALSGDDYERLRAAIQKEATTR